MESLKVLFLSLKFLTMLTLSFLIFTHNIILKILQDNLNVTTLEYYL